MRVQTFLALFLILLSMSVSNGLCLDLRSFQEFRQCATQSEHEGKWLNIHWLKDMEQAKAQARAQNKPILVFLVIGFHGEANATDC